MAELPTLIAQVIPDNPWLVRSFIPRDLYAPYAYKYYVPVTKIIVRDEVMLASKAREDGIEVNSSIPDDREIKVKIPREVTLTEKIVEMRLHRRNNRRRCRQVTMRVEMADAITSPLRFIHHEKWAQLIIDEIEFWENSDMTGHNIRPLLIVLLGVSDDNISHARQSYRILEYDPYDMIVSDEEDQKYKLSLNEDARRLGRTHAFILFFPSNVFFRDSYELLDDQDKNDQGEDEDENESDSITSEDEEDVVALD